MAELDPVALRQLAENAGLAPYPLYSIGDIETRRYLNACDPRAILTLLDRLQTAEQKHLVHDVGATAQPAAARPELDALRSLAERLVFYATDSSEAKGFELDEAGNAIRALLDRLQKQEQINDALWKTTEETENALRDMLSSARQELDALRADAERYRKAIRWALGYDEGAPHFGEAGGKGKYAWRNELMRRAAPIELATEVRGAAALGDSHSASNPNAFQGDVETHQTPNDLP